MLTASFLLLAAAANSRLVPLRVEYDGTSCWAVIEAQRYSLAADEDRIIAHFSRLRRRGLGVHLDFETVNTPWRCIGQAINTAQRAGVGRITFISEPPPRGADSQP
jgi:hypothetical protein